VTGLRPVLTGQRPVTTQPVMRQGEPCARLLFSMATVESKSVESKSEDQTGLRPVLTGQRPVTTWECWSCNARLDATHFCGSCGKVQPPAAVDYFAFLGFPRKLNLDTAKLEKEFYALSRRLHPDLFGQATEQERGWSLEQSSMLNDGYRTLKDPIRRTEYLLHLEGIELEEQSQQATEKARATGELKKQVVPPDLLEEVFELNMQLEELRMQKKIGEDDPALLEEIGEAKVSLEAKQNALLHELKVEWNEWDKTADRGVLNRMVDVLNRRNYIRNLVRDVNEAMEG